MTALAEGSKDATGGSAGAALNGNNTRGKGLGRWPHQGIARARADPPEQALGRACSCTGTALCAKRCTGTAFSERFLVLRIAAPPRSDWRHDLAVVCHRTTTVPVGRLSGPRVA